MNTKAIAHSISGAAAWLAAVRRCHWPHRAALGFLLAAAEASLAQSLPPAITSQPADRVVAQGSSASFNVSFTGTAPFSYQWRKDGVDMPDATNRALFLSHLQLTNAGDYTVLVSNLFGSATSRVALLSVGLGRVHTNAQGTRLPYRLFPPRHYDPAEKYPVVLFWHGAGEVGADNLRQLADNGQLVFLSATNQVRHPCFFLSPQLPFVVGCSSDFAFEDQTVELLQLLQTEFSFDPDRLYVTGLSMGGYISWNFIARYPSRVAAAIPMSGGWACPITDLYLGIRMPVWNFHAANDATVPGWYSDDAVASLRFAGGNPIYTRYAGGGHGIWRTAYSTPVLVDWLMAQRKGAASATRPLVTVTTPTADATFVTTSSSLNLAGTASLDSASVQLVTWTNALTRVGGQAAGTNPWSATGIPLQLGVTNLLFVTARGSSYSANFGGYTTCNDTLAVLRLLNTAPSFVKGPDVTVAADAGPQTVAAWATRARAGAALESYQVLSFALGNDAPQLFAVPPAISPGGTLTFTPARDAAGVATITVVLRDDGGTEAGGRDTSAVQSFRIIVLPANHPPLAKIAVSPQLPVAGHTNPVIVSPNGRDALVRLDGSESSDPDQDPLRFEWWEGTQRIATNQVVAQAFAVGTHTVTLWVDDGRAVASARVALEIIMPADAVHILEAWVRDSGLPAQRRPPLLATLRAAAAAFDRGNFIAGLNGLYAFQNKLRAQVEPVDSVLAARLILLTQAVIDAISDRPSQPAGRLTGQFSGGARQPDARLRLHFAGERACRYDLEASTNLLHWEKIGEAVNQGDGTFTFEDATTAKFPNRFYRVTRP